MSEPSAELPRLMLVTDRRRTRGRDLVDVVSLAVAGGVRFVQLREKDLTDDALRDLVARLRKRLPPGILLSVNDHPRVARTAGIGLHLPAESVGVRSSELPGLSIGRSVHGDTEMRRAVRAGADYLVLGTIFPTASKPGAAPGGLARVERICRQVHPLPVYAIGGVTVSRIPSLVHSGAHGVAVSGAILEANDPTRVAQAMALALRVAAPDGQPGA